MNAIGNPHAKLKQCANDITETKYASNPDNASNPRPSLDRLG